MAATKWTPQVIAAEVARKQALGLPRDYGKQPAAAPTPKLTVKPTAPVPVAAKPSYTAPKPAAPSYSAPKTVPTLNTGTSIKPTYNEQAQTNYGTGPLANILYSKKQYDTGAANQNTGLKNWSANNSAEYYSQLDPTEAAKVKGMNTQQLIDYMNTQNAAPPAAEVAPVVAPPSEITPQYVPPNYADYNKNPASPNAAPPGSTPFDPAAFEKSAIENEIRAYQERQKAALDAANSGVNTNKAYLEEQIGKLNTAKNQNDLQIQETENRFGGVYSGGMRLGQAANLKSTNEAIGGVTRDVAARNQQLLDQYGNQANSIADQIKQLQTSTPDIIRQKINDWMTKQADMTGYYNGMRTMPGQQFDRSVFQDDRNFGRGVFESDRSYDYNAGQDQIRNDAQYGGTYRDNLTVDARNQQFNQNLDREKFDYGKEVDQRDFGYQQARDKIMDGRYKQEFDRDTKQWGLEYALDKAVKSHQMSADDAQLAISRSRESRIASGGGSSGGGSSSKTPKYSYKSDPDFQDDYSAAASDPQGFGAFMSQNPQAIINKYGIDGYNALKKLIPAPKG